MIKLYYLLLISSLGLFACKSASKAYEKGDYSDAIDLSIRKLQKDPYDAEARTVLQKAYHGAVTRHEDQIRILSNSKNEPRYDRIYNEYFSLQRLYDKVKRVPSAAAAVSARDYSEYLETYRNKAAEVHEDKAEKWLRQNDGNKTAFREAYHEYNKALRYRPEDADLRQRRDSAYYKALTKVLVVPVQFYGGGYGNASHAYLLRNFHENIIRTLAHNAGGDFVKFYSEWDLRNKNLEPDQILEFHLNRINIGQPYDERSTREVSKDVVVKEIVHKPDSITKQYGKVYARVTTVRRTLLSQAELFITVRDTRGRTIWNDRFTGEHRWRTEFSTYTGDERALTDSDRSQLNKNQHDQPREEEVMEELFREIQNDLSGRMRRYYARF